MKQSFLLIQFLFFLLSIPFQMFSTKEADVTKKIKIPSGITELSIPIHFQPEININPTFEVSPCLENDSKQTQRLNCRQESTLKNKSDAALTAYSSSTILFLEDLMRRGKEQAASWMEHIVKMDKKKLFIAAILITYLGIFAPLQSTKASIKNNNNWGNWKSEISTEKLLSISNDNLQSELLLAVQQKYTDLGNPTDEVSPLIKFNRDIDKELSRLKRFINFSRWIRRLYLGRVFFISESNMAQAQEQINRLAYIKNIFRQWSIKQRTLKQSSGPNSS
ncbi:hypothetical protein HN446_01175 [bacterium]|nr:hypothetical protein [bacterium]